MTDDLLKRVAAAQAGADADQACREVGLWLRRLTHDLASPLASFRLEFQSLKFLALQTQGEVAAGDSSGVPAFLEEVLDIVDNLDGALESADSLSRRTRELAVSLAPDGRRT